MLVLTLIPLFALLAIAAVVDGRTRRIPNWLTLLIAVTGLTHAVVSGVPVTLGGALLGLVVGFALIIIPFALGAMGGGDVKLMAGVGAWLGWWATVQVYLAAGVVGMLIVVVQAAATGRLTRLFRNSSLIVANLANIDQVGAAQFAASGKSLKSVDKPLPYAVPVLIGVAIVVIMNHV